MSSKSFFEVLAYRMGELPATDLERSGSKNAARKLFKEMEEKANRFPIGRRKRDLMRLSSAGATFSDIFNHLFALPRRATECEVYSSDARNQGVCSACAAFAVTAAFETCVHRTGKSQAGRSNLAPTGLSQQNLLDCSFNSYGLAGCDGGKSIRYMQWLLGGELEMARDWPYVDSGKRWEVAENTSLRESYTSRPGSRRCMYQEKPTVVLKKMVASWDEHTERDIENILLDGQWTCSCDHDGSHPGFSVLLKGCLHVGSVPELALRTLPELPMDRVTTATTCCGYRWIWKGPYNRATVLEGEELLGSPVGGIRLFQNCQGLRPLWHWSIYCCSSV